MRVIDIPASTASVTPQPAAPGKPITNFNSPEFQAWIKSVQAMPAEQQVDAVSKKLVELNPGFDGQVTHKIDNGVVTELLFVTDNVTDISPVRASAGLQSFGGWGSGPGKGKLADLSPLQGLPLTNIRIQYTEVADLPPTDLVRRELGRNAHQKKRPAKRLRITAAARNRNS